MSESMPPAPDRTNEPTVRGVAARMLASPDPFTAEVGALIEQVADDHIDPSRCMTCSYLDGGACATYEQSVTTAFAWLLKVVDERG